MQRLTNILFFFILTNLNSQVVFTHAEAIKLAENIAEMRDTIHYLEYKTNFLEKIISLQKKQIETQNTINDNLKTINNNLTNQINAIGLRDKKLKLKIKRQKVYYITISIGIVIAGVIILH